MDTSKSAIGAVVFLCSLLSLQALADSLEAQSTDNPSHRGQPGSDRTTDLVEAYRAGRPGNLQQRPATAHRPDPGQDRRGPPGRTGPGSSGRPAITVPGSRRR